MAEFRMRYGALFTSRRFRASATVSVSVAIGSRQPAPAGLRCGDEHGRDPDIEDQPELRARWRALPRSIRPDEWVTETGVKEVPGSLVIAEEQRRTEGYYPYYCS